MIRIPAFFIACCLAIPAVHAAPVDAAAITKSISAAVSDPAKVKAYCAMSKKFEEIGEDDKKAEAAGDEIEGYFKVLGSEFESAWDAGQNSEETSAEGKAFDEAMTKLDAACGPSL